MAKEFAKKFYNSVAWKKCRDGFIKSVYGICNRCGQPGYIVHHKIKLTPNNINDPNITLNWDNLEYLCESCHSKEHMSKSKSTTRGDVKFNENGDLVKRI